VTHIQTQKLQGVANLSDDAILIFTPVNFYDKYCISRDARYACDVNIGEEVHHLGLALDHFQRRLAALANLFWHERTNAERHLWNTTLISSKYFLEMRI
jgi:hypothetical protein